MCVCVYIYIRSQPDTEWNTCGYVPFTNLFIFGCAGSALLAGLSPVAVSGAALRLCPGLALRWLLLSGSLGSGTQASVVAAGGLDSCGSQAPEHRLSNCGSQA